MRAAVLGLVTGFGLMMLVAPAQAAPATPHDFSVGTATVVQVRGGCGAGWHPRAWRDRWGNWQRRCVPNRW